MVILNEQLNRTRDLFTTDTKYMWLGTGTALASSSDTGLKHGVISTRNTLSTTLSDKLVTFNYTLNSITSNGTTFAEAGLQGNGTAVDINRVTFFPLIKANIVEYDFSTSIFFTQD